MVKLKLNFGAATLIDVHNEDIHCFINKKEVQGIIIISSVNNNHEAFKSLLERDCNYQHGSFLLMQWIAQNWIILLLALNLFTGVEQ